MSEPKDSEQKSIYSPAQVRTYKNEN